MAVSNLPTRNEIHQPLLALLSDEKEHRWSDIVEKLAEHFSLTDTELNERVPSGYKRFYHRCSFAMQDLKKAGFVESPKYAHWKITKRGNDPQNRQNRISPKKKETRENTLPASSKTLPSYVSKSLHVPNLIRKDSMKDKKPIIRTRSRKRSYGKRVAYRQLTGRKQRGIERARVREVKAVEPVQEPKPIKNVTPTETKIPWRAPRSKPDPGTYACRTIAQGSLGCGLLLFALLLSSVIAVEGGLMLFLFFFIPALLCIGGAIHSFLNSRGGW